MARGFMYRVPNQSVDSLFKQLFPPIIIPVFQTYREQVSRGPGLGGQLCFTGRGVTYSIVAGSYPHIVLANELDNGPKYSEREIRREYEEVMKAGADWCAVLEPKTSTAQQMYSFYLSDKPR